MLALKVSKVVLLVICVLWVTSDATNTKPGFEPPWVCDKRHPVINEWIRNHREQLRQVRRGDQRQSLRVNSVLPIYKDYLDELTRGENEELRPNIRAVIIAKKALVTANEASPVDKRKISDFESKWDLRLLTHIRTDDEIAAALKKEKEKRKTEKNERGQCRVKLRNHDTFCGDENTPPEPSRPKKITLKRLRPNASPNASPNKLRNFWDEPADRPRSNSPPAVHRPNSPDVSQNSIADRNKTNSFRDEPPDRRPRPNASPNKLRDFWDKPADRPRSNSPPASSNASPNNLRNFWDEPADRPRSNSPPAVHRPNSPDVSQN